MVKVACTINRSEISSLYATDFSFFPVFSSSPPASLYSLTPNLVMESRFDGSGKIMAPPRIDPLHVLRQRSQSSLPKSLPSQYSTLLHTMPPPTALTPQSHHRVQDIDHHSSLPVNHARSPASTRVSSVEGIGWQGRGPWRVDSYRPNTPASSPKNGAEVYIQTSQPVTPKVDRVLAVVESE